MTIDYSEEHDCITLVFLFTKIFQFPHSWLCTFLLFSNSSKSSSALYRQDSGTNYYFRKKQEVSCTEFKYSCILKSDFFKVTLRSSVHNVPCLLHTRFPRLFILSDLKCTLGSLPDPHPFCKGCPAPALGYTAQPHGFLWGLYFYLDMVWMQVILLGLRCLCIISG